MEDIKTLIAALLAVTCIAWLAFPAAYRLIYYRPPYVRVTKPGCKPQIIKWQQAFDKAETGATIEFFPGVYAMGKEG